MTLLFKILAGIVAFEVVDHLHGRVEAFLPDWTNWPLCGATIMLIVMALRRV